MNVISHDFIYIIPIQNDELDDASFFQGFSLGILDIDDFIITILHSPMNLLELSISRERAISLRMSGSLNYRIFPIQKKSLNQMEFDHKNPFLCILSDEATFDDAVQFVNKHDQPILHFSKKESGCSIRLDKASRNIFWEYVQTVKKYLEDNEPEEATILIRNYSNKFTEWKQKKSNMKAAMQHLIVAPNIKIFETLNYIVENNKNFTPATSNDLYLKEIQ